MSSIRIGLDGDISIANGDLVLDGGIVSAVLVSLFCDARAAGVPPEDQRGYWGDSPGDEVGSQLWLLERAKATRETAAAARDAARRALAWLLREGIASSIDVAASYVRQGFLALEVTIVRGTSRRWAHLWDAFEALDYSYDGGVVRLRGI